MDAKEFLQKAQKICKKNKCENCPLYDGDNCALLDRPDAIDSVLDFVDNYKLEMES